MGVVWLGRSDIKDMESVPLGVRERLPNTLSDLLAGGFFLLLLLLLLLNLLIHILYIHTYIVRISFVCGAVLILCVRVRVCVCGV